jgi:hypothetical protein
MATLLLTGERRETCSLVHAKSWLEHLKKLLSIPTSPMKIWPQESLNPFQVTNSQKLWKERLLQLLLRQSLNKKMSQRRKKSLKKPQLSKSQLWNPSQKLQRRLLSQLPKRNLMKLSIPQLLLRRLLQSLRTRTPEAEVAAAEDVDQDQTEALEVTLEEAREELSVEREELTEAKEE